MTTSQLTRSTAHQSQRRGFATLVFLALLGPAWSVATAWLLPAVSEFTLLGDNISELALGRYGFLQQAAFVVAGFGAVSAAEVIRRTTGEAPGSLLGSILVAIYGIAAFAMVLFPTDPIDDPSDVRSLSPAGMVHVIGAGIGFLSVLVAMSVLTWSFRRDTRWRPLTPWIALFPAATVVLLAVQAEGPLVGLLQRLLLATISAWLVLIVLRARAVRRAELAASR